MQHVKFSIHISKYYMESIFVIVIIINSFHRFSFVPPERFFKHQIFIIK